MGNNWNLVSRLLISFSLKCEKLGVRWELRSPVRMIGVVIEKVFRCFLSCVMVCFLRLSFGRYVFISIIVEVFVFILIVV